MRKILLGTTAVVGAALIGATSAQAQQAPTVRIGGYFEFNVGYINDDMDSTQFRPGTATVTTGTPAVGAPRRDRWDFRQGDTEIHVFVTAKAANGLSYGMTMELQFDGINSAGAGTGIDTDEAYGFISSPTLGTLRFGDEDSAASLMQTRLPSITGLGPDNMWDEFAARSPDGQAPYLVSGINDGSDATKIIYLSPQFFGFDFGLSFAPNGREGEDFRAGGSTTLQRDPLDATLRNELSYALRYRGSFSNVGLAATFAGMRADAQTVIGPITAANPNLQDVAAYHLGLNLSAFGFTVGGEYNWGRYGGPSTGRLAVREGIDDSSNWALGVTYVAGPIAVGAFYGQGERDNGGALADRKQTVWGLGAAYTLAPGLELVANYVRVEDRNLANSASNPTVIELGQRNVDFFTVGTRIAF